MSRMSDSELLAAVARVAGNTDLSDICHDQVTYVAHVRSRAPQGWEIMCKCADNLFLGNVSCYNHYN